ncbi:hypothetical protein [Alkalihalobacillus deserti]|uniref:hypothetical protein n=1 Tax=Alkalihalobacillus deserti TaxID=2879466 RepID=UPI001D1430C4|nr:hypothetical protein [Alkalihalobacillus deserti]
MMYIGILILILVGIGLIIWGLKLTNAEHKDENYIGSAAYGGTGFVEGIVLFLLTLILKLIPYWLMKVILILFGLSLIGFGIFLLLGR